MTGLVVVGDALLDVDILGSANRLCPDEPAPVVDVAGEVVRPGGAGLAAWLAATDGVPVTLVTALAGDADGDRLRAALRNIDVVGTELPGATPVKTRVRSGDRSVTRLDRGGAPPTDPPAVTDEMVDALRSAGAVLVSDYGRGLLRNQRLRALLTELAGRTPVVWDPHPRGPEPTRGAWLVVPNLAEARAATGGDGVDVAGIAATAATLRERWVARAVAITLGSRGALLDHGGLPMAIPAPAVPPGDACGAGDRFAVTATSALLRGRTLDEAARAAVEDAAGFVGSGGVTALGRPAPTRQAAGSRSAAAVIARTRAAGGVVVATGGCFDLLHTGHLRTLRAARELGDCLVVCVNSDESVRRLKGGNRPINAEADRVELLASLNCVDAVALFDADTPEPLLERLRPDLWVKGGDYATAELSEVDVVRSWGGEVVVVPYHAGRSTTRLASLAGID